MSGITSATVIYGYAKAECHADRSPDWFLQDPETGDWHADDHPCESIQELALAVESVAFAGMRDSTSIFDEEPAKAEVS